MILGKFNQLLLKNLVQKDPASILRLRQWNVPCIKALYLVQLVYVVIEVRYLTGSPPTAYSHCTSQLRLNGSAKIPKHKRANEDLICSLVLFLVPVLCSLSVCVFLCATIFPSRSHELTSPRKHFANALLCLCVLVLLFSLLATHVNEELYYIVPRCVRTFFCYCGLNNELEVSKNCLLIWNKVPPPLPSGYATQLLTERSWAGILAMAAAIRWRRNAWGPCTVWCQLVHVKEPRVVRISGDFHCGLSHNHIVVLGCRIPQIIKITNYWEQVLSLHLVY